MCIVPLSIGEYVPLFFDPRIKPRCVLHSGETTANHNQQFEFRKLKESVSEQFVWY